MVKKEYAFITLSWLEKFTFLQIILLFFTFFKIYAQDQKPIVEITTSKINLNEPFVLSVTVKNLDNRPVCKFPDLTNFKKRAVSYSLINSTVNGKPTTEHKVSQEYMPSKAGVFNFSPQIIQINETAVSTTNFSVTVAQSEKDETEENFKDFIDGSAYEFVDVKDDAFFGITTNKLRPYVGEGFLVTIAFYIASTNKAEMDFVNENGQLDNILKRFRPKNCWEENLGISEIKSGKLIKIGNKKYFQYKIFQALYYPFNTQPIILPSLKWQMLKYKIAKDQEVSKSKKEDIKIYSSRQIVIRPQPLPKNNKFQTNFVGDFQLDESINKEKVQTGKSFNYTFKLQGSGNLAIIKFPESLSDSLFEIYEPTVNQHFISNSGKLIAEKTFNFNIVPKFAGNYSLKNYFYIHYFNIKTRSYQTLAATKTIEVVGNNIKVDLEPVATENDIYHNLADLKSDESNFNFRFFINSWTNVLIILMLVSMIYIIWPNKK
jgi:BatD DUF11 like domain